MKKKKLIIMISGRGSNMKAILDNTQNGELRDLAEVISVFCNNPMAEGIKTARHYDIPVKVIDSKTQKRTFYNQKLKNWLSENDPHLIILAGYMLILPPDIIEAFPCKIINIHPADTRRHQGLHGYEWAYENRLDETIITIHYVDQGLDTGKIISQYKVDLSDCHTLKDVERSGLAVEHEMYGKTIADLLKKRTWKDQ